MKGIQECWIARRHNCSIAIRIITISAFTAMPCGLLQDIDRPNCELGFDVVAGPRDEELHAMARKLAPHTIGTTSDYYVRLPRFQYQPNQVDYAAAHPYAVRDVHFGGGFIDYEAFFTGLREGGFDGLANYEMCSPLRGGGSKENLDHCATTYVRWMREHGFA